MLRASNKRKLRKMMKSMMAGAKRVPDFDANWDRTRWIEVPFEPDEPKGCRIYGRDRNGREIRRYVRWRFARFMEVESGSFNQNPAYHAAVAWARENLGYRGWTMNSFRGRWMFITFHDHRKAARFKLMRC